MISWVKKRLWLRRVRREKALYFHLRWDAACRLLWLELSLRPVSLATLDWFERKHARLMRVCAQRR
jgi:hypothetical protein